MRRIQLGGFCPRGTRGHVWIYTDDDAGACGSKSWDLFIEVEDEDLYLLPEWVLMQQVEE